jgi:uncharacterized membrane protein YhaH (DUF805 family)
VQETTPSVLLLIDQWRRNMNWYMEVVKKYAVFSGRARRAEYWWFFLINFVIGIVLSILSSIVMANSNSNSSFNVFSCISGLYGLALLLPGLGVVIRRLHDTGKSGWWIFISLIPLVGEIWLLVILATDSQPGDNQYGPNPKTGPAPVVVQP